MVDFTDILSKKVEEVEKPKPKPPGTYIAQILGMPTQVTQNTKNGEMHKLAFKVKLLQPQADVDSDQLSEHPPISDWPPMTHDIILSEDGWSLKRFLTEVLDVDQSGGKSFGEALTEVGGRNLLVTIQHEPYTDRDGQPAIAARIKATAKA